MRNVSKYWPIIRRTMDRFTGVDGGQRAAAFGYYALFSTFPLVLLFVTVGSYFVDRETATREMTQFISQYIPVTPEQHNFVVRTIGGVLKSRGQVGIIALCLLVWSALQFLRVLIRATNRAWASRIYNWWQLPLKNLVLLGIVTSAVLLGILAPAAARLVKHWLPFAFGPVTWLFELLVAGIPMVVLFYGFSMLYKLAPSRRTKFAEVWFAALTATILFRLAETFFGWYAHYLAHWNALYGALGGMMGFLMWVYVSGWIYVAGACFCAAQADRDPESNRRVSG